MQLFDENNKRTCCCNTAINKGIYEKTFINDSFCIYGNLMHGRSILLNYHGKLIKNSEVASSNNSNAPCIYLYYCFDNNWNEKKIVNMNICTKNSMPSYCAIIDLPENENINIAFTNDDTWDTAEKGTYQIKIYKDVEKEILKRYNLDSTPPVIMTDNYPVIPSGFFAKLKQKTYSFFTSLKSIVLLKH